MKATDRKLYCRVSNPYVDRPVRINDQDKFYDFNFKNFQYSIGYSATISAPHMHAHALQLLINNLEPSSKVLDVGSGSGFLTACFFRAMKLNSSASTGMVIGIEHHPRLVEFAVENINSDDPQMIESGKLKIIQGDGRLGCSEHAPYDAIHVGAAAAEIPDKLLEQLKNGGRMICPVGPQGETQQLVQYDKSSEGEITKKVLMAVVYVPLTDLDAYK